MINVGIIRYPGSNCDIETMKYFNFESTNNKCFYIWHKTTDTTILDKVDLLVLPGGFAFGDRDYVRATDDYVISPGTMATKSPVTVIIHEAVKRKIPVLGICNGFQILTQLNLLPGKLTLNNSKQFICKKSKCNIEYRNEDSVSEFHTSEFYIANSFGKYINDEKLSDQYSYFLKYENGDIAGVLDKKNKIIGMMPHPERNNIDFKHVLLKILFDNKEINEQMYFDKCIKELMYSEHISYKTTKKYLRNLHTNEPWVVQGPGENAGIVDIGKSENGDEYCIAIRIESHNHPTYINPYEGAATGVGGIMRDIFTMGARPIGILDFLRFGTDKKSNELLKGAIQGISYYGNCVGVPNIGGDLYLHSSYNTNPLVNVGCLGIVKKENIIYGNALTNESYMIYVGSKTGNEGINGAAMASATFKSDEIDESLKECVQKSDPFLEKLLLEACCEIGDKKLAEGMQDMGAGGLLCASLEVVVRGIKKKKIYYLGCEIYLDKIPTKYPMENCNKLISESQERMLILAQKENIDKISEILNRWDLEFAIIGKTNLTGKYNVFDNDVLLYSECVKNLDCKEDYCNLPIKNDYVNDLSEPIKKKDMKKWEIYDMTVGNRTIKGPDKPGSFAILDLYEVGKQAILTWGESFDECFEHMSLFENVKPLCLVNCLNYGDPKYSLYDLKSTVDDLTLKSKLHNIPVVGGNVSLYNTTNDNSIRPTPIILMLGISC
jgi:phosphoribosylformylglycinamidine (FGAM) synthase-like amidotransferase family enzyme/selenophosphate synthetase-related protein